MRVFNLLILLLVTFSLSAQKVKYKKGKVLVDKVHKYNFTKTKNKNKLDKYELTDLDGNLILSLTDTTFTYLQLPNELSPREAFHAYLVEAPTLDLKEVMQYEGVYKYAKQRIKDLKKVGFFKEGGITKENFYKFLERQKYKRIQKLKEELNATNAKRKRNSEMTGEKFEPLFSRKPGYIDVTDMPGKTDKYNIYDGSKKVGEFWVTGSKGSRPKVVAVNNMERRIAEGKIYNKADKANDIPEDAYNIKPYLSRDIKWFYGTGFIKTSIKIDRDKLQKMAEFLINEGFL